MNNLTKEFLLSLSQNLRSNKLSSIKEVLNNEISIKMIDDYIVNNKKSKLSQLSDFREMLNHYEETGLLGKLYMCPTCGLYHKSLNELIFSYSLGENQTAEIGCYICLFLRDLEVDHSINTMESLDHSIYIYGDAGTEDCIDEIELCKIENDIEGMADSKEVLDCHAEIQNLFWDTFNNDKGKIFKTINNLLTKYDISSKQAENPKQG